MHVRTYINIITYERTYVMVMCMYVSYYSEYYIILKNTLHFLYSTYSTSNETNSTNYLTNELDGELCYIQTSDGKIVSIHYGMADNCEGINVKKSIAGTFQANFDSNNKDVVETDASSIHTSHYRYIRSFHKHGNLRSIFSCFAVLKGDLDT